MYNLVIRQKHSLILIAIFKNQSINRNEFVERRGKAGVFMLSLHGGNTLASRRIALSLALTKRSAM